MKLRHQFIARHHTGTMIVNKGINVFILLFYY